MINKKIQKLFLGLLLVWSLNNVKGMEVIQSAVSRICTTCKNPFSALISSAVAITAAAEGGTRLKNQLAKSDEIETRDKLITGGLLACALVAGSYAFKTIKAVVVK